MNTSAIEIAPRLTVLQFTRMLSAVLEPNGRFRYIRFAIDDIIMAVCRLWHAFQSKQWPLNDEALAMQFRRFIAILSPQNNLRTLQFELVHSSDIFNRLQRRLPTSALRELLEVIASYGSGATAIEDVLPQNITESDSYDTCLERYRQCQHFHENLSHIYIQNLYNDPTINFSRSNHSFLYQGQDIRPLNAILRDILRNTTITINNVEIFNQKAASEELEEPIKIYEDCVNALKCGAVNAEKYLKLTTQASWARVNALYLSRFYNSSACAIDDKEANITIDGISSPGWISIRLSHIQRLVPREGSVNNKEGPYFTMNVDFLLHRQSLEEDSCSKASVIHSISPLFQTRDEAEAYSRIVL